MRSFLVKLSTGIAGLGVSSLALATDYSDLTDAVVWTDVATALIAVGAAIVGIVVVMRGVKMVVRAVRGA